MDNFNFIKSERAYETKFYQFPQILLYGEHYKHLSDSAKLAYMILRDRLEYSLKNNWIDQDNNVYFIFTNKELKNLFNWSNDKLNKVKKDLEKEGLLFQKNMGFDPIKRKNIPNRLYLSDLEVTAKDVYIKTAETLDTSGNPKIGHRDISTETLDTSGNPKIGHRDISTETLDTSGNPKIGHNLYNTNNLDTNRHLIDTEKDQLQDQLLLESFVEIMKDTSIATFIPERVLDLIKTFSATYEEAQQTVQTIHNAKSKAEERQGVSFAYEELENLGINPDGKLYNTLLKAYQKQKTEKIVNFQNLLFVYVRNWFEEEVIPATRASSDHEQLPEVSLRDWTQVSEK